MIVSAFALMPAKWQRNHMYDILARQLLTNTIDHYFEKRISLMHFEFKKSHNFWNAKHLSAGWKLLVYHACVISAFKFGQAESKLTQAHFAHMDKVYLH